ncbi:LutC/YkgG family protein [Conexibacter arvalis]|uniref:L-lactate dehydrogenase complex protein LldG n=1 Tax=Conexibacter arvalis TaxID=912552 RepID=A0A840IBG7_9ACTN|nr:lactate utilization protein C [Conexibacter arvalis]MBB4661992.1 L-lactate dehydrogenase complex protein LldG [Conexibacter arvalis]
MSGVTDPAKEAILARIRGALKDVPEAETAADVAVARDYRVSGSLAGDALAELFAERCADYRADVRLVAADELPAAIAAALERRGARRLAIPADLPAEWRVDGVEWVEDAIPGDGAASAGAQAGAGARAGAGAQAGAAQLSHAQISATDGVLTGCAVAIAETGVIVLDGGPAQGRRSLTLLPDYHLCVVARERIVELVPEAVAALHAAAVEGRPMTWIAGPSATSDIEFNRVEGVHGPRTLDVLVVG